jgi:hypothetical protein
MNKLTTMLLAASAVSAWAGTASAMPLDHGVTVDSSNLLQEARLVCNRAGHCFQTRRHVYRDYGGVYEAYPGYGGSPYAYYDAPSYFYDEGPGVGFGFDWR